MDDNFKSLELVNGIPDFIVKLYKMLMETIGEVVSWSETGNSFVIIDIFEFTKNLLPSHFKHGNFASFVRQLNKYGFNKVKTDDAKKAQTWEFCHSNFRKGQPLLLSQIKRKTAAKTEKKDFHPADSSSYPIENSSDVSLLKSQVKYLENVQTEMSLHLKSLTLQYQQILEKMSDFRHTISTQEQVIRSLIEYIPSEKKNCKSCKFTTSIKPVIVK
jgi:osomolarity two-component system response regulator SKN7